MKPCLFAEPLLGIVPPIVTPLLGRDTLDVAGLERLVENVIAGGVSGLFLLGTTGEAPSLSYRLRRELVERVCRQNASRVPLFVGITDTAFVESLELARHAAEAGADAVVLAPPYYLPPGQPELQEYLEHLLAELPLPLFLYNFPGLTKVTIELETVRRLLDQPRVAGIKDSSGNLIYFKRLARMAKARPDWTLLMGPEELLADAVFAGGHGGVNGGANVFPQLYVELCRAAQAGDLARARELQGRVLRVSEALYTVGRHPSAVIKGIKCALSCLNLCSDVMAEPFHHFEAAERRRIEELLPELMEFTRDLPPARPASLAVP